MNSNPRHIARNKTRHVAQSISTKKETENALPLGVAQQPQEQEQEQGQEGRDRARGTCLGKPPTSQSKLTETPND